jgi:uncharacterized surface anchored protein
MLLRCNYSKKGVKQGDALLPQLFNIALEYVIRKIQENQVEFKLKGKHLLLGHVDDNMYTLKEKKNRKFN